MKLPEILTRAYWTRAYWYDYQTQIVEKTTDDNGDIEVVYIPLYRRRIWDKDWQRIYWDKASKGIIIKSFGDYGETEDLLEAKRVIDKFLEYMNREPIKVSERIIKYP